MDEETAKNLMVLLFGCGLFGTLFFMDWRYWRRLEKEEFKRVCDLTNKLSLEMTLLRQKVDAAERALARVEGRQYVKW